MNDKRHRAIRLMPEIEADVKKAELSNKQYADKWSVSSGLISKICKVNNIELPKAKPGPSGEKWIQIDPFIGVYTDKDIGKKFGVSPCAVRIRRNKMGIPAVARDVFMGVEYRARADDWLEEGFTYSDPFASWGRSPELAEFIKELKCASIRSRLALC